jgi:replication factor C large subunit
MLWIEKYQPKNISQFVGQKEIVKKAKNWLSQFKPGQALLFYGPPGTGKTLLAKLLAKEYKFELIEPTEEKLKNIENIKNLLSKPLWHKGRLILIELDCLSSQDRGAITTIFELIKKCPWPIILTTTNPWQQRIRALHTSCILLKFNRIAISNVMKKLEEIAKLENIKFDSTVLKKIAQLSNGDMRAAIIDLQLLSTSKSIKKDDVENLGLREREYGIFELLQQILKTKDLNKNRQAIWLADRDPDEIFLWIEKNLDTQFNEKELPQAYELLAKANMFREFVKKQQNWRFKGYMVDMLAGLALLKKSQKFYFPFKAIEKRKYLENLEIKQLAIYCNCSTKIIKRDYIPFLKILKSN